MARKSAPLHCSESEKAELQDLIQNAKQPRIAERATLVLEFIQGSTITEIAERHSAQPNTVIKWKRRYAEQGIEGLLNLPRGNTKDVYGKDFRKRLVELVHSSPPDGAEYWTGPLLAKALDVPLYAVHVYLRKSQIHLLDLRNKSEGTDNEAGAEASIHVGKSIDIDCAIESKESEPKDDEIRQLRFENEALRNKVAHYEKVISAIQEAMKSMFLIE